MTVKELRSRNDRAQELRVFQLSDEIYFVESAEGKIAYKVQWDNGNSSCTCADYASNTKKDPEFQCKHMLAVLNGNGNILRMDSPDGVRPKLDERFITTIQGKDFVIYSGLLDLAHQRGLQTIQVEVVQYPTKDNGLEAICKATVESKTGETFIEWGDANPKNVNPKIAQHVLRMAGTRAKARALRDFTNIGMTCLEELGDLDEVVPDDKKAKRSASGKKTESGEDGKPCETQKSDSRPIKDPAGPTASASAAPSAAQAEPNPVAPAAQGEGREESGPKPSMAQVKAIENLARRRNITGDELEEMVQNAYGTTLSNINASEASSFIRVLQQSA